MKKNNNVSPGHVSASKERGITLIALIITIIVMLILVMVSIRIAIQTGLFDSAGKATQKWDTAQDAEAELGNGKVDVDGVIYNSIDEYVTTVGKDDNTIRFTIKVNGTAYQYEAESGETWSEWLQRNKEELVALEEDMGWIINGTTGEVVIEGGNSIAGIFTVETIQWGYGVHYENPIESGEYYFMSYT